MAFELRVVTAFMAGLAIIGKRPDGTSASVTVLDWSGIKESADQRLCPILQPDITQQITLDAYERDSFGSGVTAKQTLTYSVPYVLLYEPVGGERNLAPILANLVTTMSAIVSAVIANDTPSNVSVDLQIAAFTLGGTVNDAAGNPFHGVQITVRVKEFIN